MPTLVTKALVVFGLLLSASPAFAGQKLEPCSTAWNKAVEAKVDTGDGQGHGPDIGSPEWRSVVVFKLGLRGNTEVPPTDSNHWCRYIDNILFAKPPASPAFDCSQAQGSIETLICQTPALAELDRQMAAVFTKAQQQVTGKPLATLKAIQRGWIKGRNECWKASDHTGCVRYEYRHRLAELQATYQLVPAGAPVNFTCAGDNAPSLRVTFLPTALPTSFAEFNGEKALLYQQPSRSGVRYQGANQTLTEQPTGATLQWGQGPPLHCRRQ